MISSSFNIAEFFEHIKDKSYLDAIYVSDQEATRAERLSYRRRMVPDSVREESVAYAEAIKKFIDYIRYGVLRSNLSEESIALFVSAGKNLRKNHGSPTRS